MADESEDAFAWLFEPFGAFAGGLVRVPVSDLSRSRHFYVEILKCTVKSESEWEIEISGTFPARLCLVPKSILADGVCISPVAMMTFTRDLRELEARFAGLGLPFYQPLTMDENGRAKFTIEDPDGHLISFSGPP